MTVLLSLQGAASCKQKSYTIDFCGQQSCWLQRVAEKRNPDNGKKSNPSFMEGMTTARGEYCAGEHVILYYFFVATDTDYRFLLDGEEINPDYETGKGYIIHFVMPEHDVKLQCISRNSMIREVPPTGDDENE